MVRLSFPSGKGHAERTLEEICAWGRAGAQDFCFALGCRVAGEACQCCDGGAGDDAADGTDSEGRSDLDSHIGCRGVSTDRIEPLAQGSSMGSPSFKGHRSRESAELESTKVSVLLVLSFSSQI